MFPGPCCVFRLFFSFFKLVPSVVLDIPPPLFLFDSVCVSAASYRSCTVLETKELYKRLFKKKKTSQWGNFFNRKVFWKVEPCLVVRHLKLVRVIFMVEPRLGSRGAGYGLYILSRRTNTGTHAHTLPCYGFLVWSEKEIPKKHSQYFLSVFVFAHTGIWPPYRCAHIQSYVPHVFVPFCFQPSGLQLSASEPMRYCCFWACKFLFFFPGQVHVKISLSFHKQGLLSISHLHHSSSPEQRVWSFESPPLPFCWFWWLTCKEGQCWSLCHEPGCCVNAAYQTNQKISRPVIVVNMNFLMLFTEAALFQWSTGTIYFSPNAFLWDFQLLILILQSGHLLPAPLLMTLGRRHHCDCRAGN